MIKNHFKKIIMGATLAAVVAFSATSAACNMETAHPRATITVEFNSQTYDIDYQLYRNMYPQTVKHFIELADNGFYNDMIVHNYTSNDWFTGAYSYNAGESSYSEAYDNGNMKSYLEEDNNKEQAYYALAETVLTPSVFSSYKYDEKGNKVAGDKMGNLVGEFKSNQHTIEKGELSARLGTLKMFYYEKKKDEDTQVSQKVHVVKDGKLYTDWDYKYNCATSLFSMQVGGSSSYSAADYCVFAELLDDGARDALNELLEAVKDYASDNSGFSKTVADVAVDLYDDFSEFNRGQEVNFTMTSAPIIIKSVKIKKY